MNLRGKHAKSNVGMLAELFGKSRGAYYKHDKEKLVERKLSDSFLVETVRDIRKEAPMIGGYKLFLMLRSVYPERMLGRDSFYRLLHRHHLMHKPVKRRHTTDSNHHFHKWKNLIKNHIPEGPRRLLVADITYVQTSDGVCYLHLVTDAYTHEIVGWSLSDTLHAAHTLAALQEAVSDSEGYDLSRMIHHSDRGIQYCCNMYVDYLQSLGASISMTEDYKPTDNAIAERVNGILKSEWLYAQPVPANMAEAKDLLSKAIEFYNTKRPHMSIGMMTPRQKREAYEKENNIKKNVTVSETPCVKNLALPRSEDLVADAPRSSDLGKANKSEATTCTPSK